MIDKVLNDYVSLINEHIDSLLPDKDLPFKKVFDAERYSLLSGGKRIRPIILLEFCRLCGGKNEDALDFAASLEMIHTYSLIHDDLPCMDNDDFRRGNPSCHKVFGEDIALLAGDKLLTTAFAVAAASNVPNDRKIKALEVLANRANGMINGQVLDLKFETEKPSEQMLRDMYILKTGCLISAAAEIGCILGGADEETINIAKSYALNLAMAFQIIDDILDITGNEELLGKPVGSDADNNKTTLATILGIEKASQEAEKCTYEALGLLDMLNGDTQILKELTNYLLKRNF